MGQAEHTALIRELNSVIETIRFKFLAPSKALPPITQLELAMEVRGPEKLQGAIKALYTDSNEAIRLNPTLAKLYSATELLSRFNYGRLLVGAEVESGSSAR